MKNLIQHIAEAIVEYPDQVVVTEEQEEGLIVYRLRVAESDMGRVIGKEGRIANAMRTLLRVAAIRRGTRAILEIGEGVGAARLERAAEVEPEPEPELEPEPEPELEPELEPEPKPEPEEDVELEAEVGAEGEDEL
jgi:hypothetical protein